MFKRKKDKRSLEENYRIWKLWKNISKKRLKQQEWKRRCTRRKD
jgi:hypothetical protein